MDHNTIVNILIGYLCFVPLITLHEWAHAWVAWKCGDNTAYNESLTRQAHAEGMQAHLTNMQQVDTLTSQIRRQMTERYQIEF